MSTIKENVTHNRKVERIQRRLTDLDLPVLPLNCVKSPFYVPDIITKVDEDQRARFDLLGDISRARPQK